MSPFRWATGSEGVEPCQQIGVPLPTGCGRRPQHTISFFEGPTFRLQVGLCVKVCRVQADVTHPVPDDGDINARGKQVNGSRVPQGVGRNPFLAESRSFLRGHLQVPLEPKAHTGSTQGVAVAVAEYYFVGATGFRFKNASKSSTVSGHKGEMRSLRPFPQTRTCAGESKRMSLRRTLSASAIRAPVL